MVALIRGKRPILLRTVYSRPRALSSAGLIHLLKIAVEDWDLSYLQR